MATEISAPTWTIRPAQASEQSIIEAMIKDANLNPRDLHWSRFLVVDEAGQVLGIGQIKPHKDGSRELASLAVLPEHQGRGLGAALMEALLAQAPGLLYLMCEAHNEAFYQRWGFQVCRYRDMPTYFRRIYPIMLVMVAFLRLKGQRVHLLIMRRLPAS